LTTAQLASHRHKVDTNNEWNESHGNWQTETGQWRQVHAGGTNYKPWTSYEGSGNSHNHGTMNFAVRYLDVIICSKD
jgi:flagellar basal body rod protein FlgF